MNISSKLIGAGLGCALIAVAAVGATANVAEIAAADDAAIVIALNPQPLLPGAADREDDFDFRA
jgi:hypothetical protein